MNTQDNNANAQQTPSALLQLVRRLHRQQQQKQPGAWTPRGAVFDATSVEEVVLPFSPFDSPELWMPASARGQSSVEKPGK